MACCIGSLTGRSFVQSRAQTYLHQPCARYRHTLGQQGSVRFQRQRRSCSVRVVAEEAPEKLSGVKEGSRVRVTRSIPVYHSLKFKGGLDLEGKEGEVLGDVSQYKGKVLSSTLPYKIQFMVPHEEAGEVKIIAHLVRCDILFRSSKRRR